MNEPNNTLKQISRFVCIEVCGKVTEYNKCKECEFMKLINRLLKYYSR